eukprot:6179887-Pleurochrysis_carterae.AAC.9
MAVSSNLLPNDSDREAPLQDRLVNASLVNVLFMQRMTDAGLSGSVCSQQQSTLGTCWLSGVWKLMAIMGLMAARDFNSRASHFIREFAEGPVQRCNKRLSVSVADSGSDTAISLRLLAGLDKQPSALVGPALTATLHATASWADLYQIPQVGYTAASSKTLRSQSSGLMRISHTSNGLAEAICTLWTEELGYNRGALVHAVYETSTHARFANAWSQCASIRTLRGCLTCAPQVREAQDAAAIDLEQALRSSCERRGLTLSAIAAESSGNLDPVFRTLEESAFPALMLSVHDAANVLEAAAARGGLLGESARTVWMMEASVVLDVFHTLNESAKQALHGSLVIGAASATDARFSKENVRSQWTGQNTSFFNSHWPSAWHLPDDYFDELTDEQYEAIRFYAAYEYDAVALVGLLACGVAPSGSLPSAFASAAWRLLPNVSFDGLSGPAAFDALGSRSMAGARYEIQNVYYAPSGLGMRSVAISANNTWSWAGGSMNTSGLVFPDNRSAAPQEMSIVFLQRMSDARYTDAASCGPMWRDGKCWLQEDWQATAALGMLAVEHFNARDGRYVPAFGNRSLQSCNRRIKAYVYDSGSTGEQSVSKLLDHFYKIRGSLPDAIIGPALSEAAEPAAATAGALNVVQVRAIRPS